MEVRHVPIHFTTEINASLADPKLKARLPILAAPRLRVRPPILASRR